jgi:hypothetical protein
MIEANAYLSQRKIAETLFPHYDIVKRLIVKELNLRLVNFKWILHTLTASRKLGRVKIRGNISGSSTDFKLTISLVPSGG